MFDKIDRKFTRNGNVMFQTRFSRWVARLSSRRPVLGLLFRSIIMSTGIWLLFVLATQGEHLLSTAIVWIALMLFFSAWIALSDSWRRRNAIGENGGDDPHG
jgi:hypothetical protein